MIQPCTIVNPEDGTTLAIHIKANYSNEGIAFFTPDEYSQQLAYMKHPKGHKIIPHIHNHIERKVFYTQEVLVIKSGSVRVDFYNNDKKYLVSTVLKAGDVILLASGGHGFEVLEDLEMYEIKQGPFVGEADKTRFEGTIEKINIVEE